MGSGAHHKRCLPEEEDNCAGCFSSTGGTHSQNNLINNVLFSCVRVRNLSDFLDHCYSPGNGDRPTDQQGEYTTTTTFTAEEKISNILSTTTTSSSLQQVA